MADMWQFLAQKKPTNGKYEPVPLYFLKDRDWEKDQGQTGTVGNVPGCGVSANVRLEVVTLTESQRRDVVPSPSLPRSRPQ